MCGEGLTETDGEDYRISDCKAGRQSLGGRGGGSPLRANDPSLTPQYGEQEEPHIS